MEKHRYRCRKDNPSFSSTLLDVIYRSIDERDDDKSVVYRKSMRNRQSTDGCFQVDHKQNADSYNVPPSTVGGLKNISGDHVVVRRKSATGFETSSVNSYFNSNTRSSDCRYESEILSSDAERIYGFPARPKPIRTVIPDDECDTREMNGSMYDQKHQSDDLKPKAKSRAMKIYAYLKKGKQPLSPGGRLATFVISLFRTTNTKKSKLQSPFTGGHNDSMVHENMKLKSAPNASTCSSASSFSRSWLSKTPSSSSRAKVTADMKRSKRFYPASMIVNEYSESRGHESLIGDGSNPPALKFDRNSINEEVKKQFMKRNRHIEATSINMLKKYQRKVEYAIDSIKSNASNNDDDDDEAGSYASSDLFELDHLSAIGMDRCMQELPLYETTSVDANRAIANGLLM